MADAAPQVIRDPAAILEDLRSKVAALAAEVEAAGRGLAAQPARPSPWAALTQRIKDNRLSSEDLGTLTGIVLSLAIQAQAWEQLLAGMEAGAPAGPAPGGE